MQFNITVIKTTNENKGKYNMLDVAFTNQVSGKVESKKVVSFVHEGVYKALSGAKMDDQFSITSIKPEGKQYWEWSNASPIMGDALAAQAAPAAAYKASTTAYTPTAKSTYETPDERARKQVLIVRQSSLSTAADLLSIGAKIPPSRDLVLKEAQALVDWVFENNESLVPSLIDMPSDDIQVE